MVVKKQIRRMLDVNSAAVFAVERPVPLNDFEQVRIINAINANFFLHLKIQLMIQRY